MNENANATEKNTPFDIANRSRKTYHRWQVYLVGFLTLCTIAALLTPYDMDGEKINFIETISNYWELCIPVGAIGMLWLAFWWFPKENHPADVDEYVPFESLFKPNIKNYESKEGDEAISEEEQRRRQLTDARKRAQKYSFILFFPCLAMGIVGGYYIGQLMRFLIVPNLAITLTTLPLGIVVSYFFYQKSRSVITKLMTFSIAQGFVWYLVSVFPEYSKIVIEFLRG